MYCKICGRELNQYELLIIDGVVKGPVCREGYQCYEDYPVRIPAPAFGKMVMVHKIAARYVAS